MLNSLIKKFVLDRIKKEIAKKTTKSNELINEMVNMISKLNDDNAIIKKKLKKLESKKEREKDKKWYDE